LATHFLCGVILIEG